MMINVGFLGASKIGRTLAKTFLNYPEKFNLYAIGSRDIERARNFKEEFNFKKCYGSYEELCNDEDVDLIYISTYISNHYNDIKLALNHNKHVLVEKAFTLNSHEAKEVIALARSKNLLLAEAIWTRYMPSRNLVKSLIDSGIIGDIYYLEANLGYEIGNIPRLYKKELGGGAMLDVGVYPLNFIDMFVSSTLKDIEVKKRILPSGVDETIIASLSYENGVLAQFFTTLNNATSRDGFIYGKDGYIKVININNPERIEVYRHDDKENNFATLVSNINIKKEFNGYEYELLETYDSILNGRIENPSMPLDKSLKIMEIIDQILK